MPGPNTVFKETCQNYLKEIQRIDLQEISEKLGLTTHGDNFFIRCLNREYNISEHGFQTISHETAPYDVFIVLSRYLLMCPAVEPAGAELSSFRDFKDSGPLTVYFSHDVETKMARHFAGKKDELIMACRSMGGYESGVSAGYDVGARFDVLPKIPLVLLFNDRDNEFDATVTLLFEKRAESYLDAECLAILGNLLCQSLKT
jgi:hypothetical protein